MKFAVSSYSFSQYISAGKMTQLDAVKQAADMGFDGIEFTDLISSKASLDEQLEYAKIIKNKADICKINVVAYLVGADLYRGGVAEVERLCGQLQVASALGASIMRHDVCYSEKHGEKTVSFERMLPVIAENARKIAEYADTLGIRTVSENHGFVAQDSDRVEKLYNTVAHDNYGILIDIGNFACADEDSALAVSRLAPYAFHVHAKDFRVYPYGTEPKENSRVIVTRGCNKIVGCALGDGDIPVARCLDILKKAGYDGYVTIEFEGVGDCIEEITKGLDFLKSNI